MEAEGGGRRRGVEMPRKLMCRCRGFQTSLQQQALQTQSSQRVGLRALAGRAQVDLQLRWTFLFLAINGLCIENMRASKWYVQRKETLWKWSKHQAERASPWPCSSFKSTYLREIDIWYMRLASWGWKESVELSHLSLSFYRWEVCAGSEWLAPGHIAPERKAAILGVVTFLEPSLC